MPSFLSKPVAEKMLREWDFRWQWAEPKWVQGAGSYLQWVKDTGSRTQHAHGTRQKEKATIQITCLKHQRGAPRSDAPPQVMHGMLGLGAREWLQEGWTPKNARATEGGNSWSSECWDKYPQTRQMWERSHFKSKWRMWLNSAGRQHS